MKFKKIFILFLLVLILVLAGKNAQHENIDKINLQFASWGSKSEIDILKPILREFELKNPDIKVEFIHIPQNYFQKIHLLFASNLAPDVIFMNNLYLPIYANAGLLEEIREAKGERKRELQNHSPIHPFTLSTFYAKSLKAMSYNDKLYAVPRDISTLVIYYNKDIFDKYNVPCPNKYWSFNDFLILAQKLTKDANKDGKTDIWGISFEEDLLFYLPYLMSEGGGVLSDDLKTMIINTPESKKGLQFYADLRNKYNVAPKKSESASATMAQLFLQGKLAMHLSGRWLVPKYRTDAKFDWNVINFPTGDKGSIVPLDASGWSIAKSSKHKKEAMRLIEYLSSKESIGKFSRSGLIVPARIDVAEGDFLQDKKSPRNNRVFIDIIKTAQITPVSTNYSEIQDDLKEKMNYLFNAAGKF
ncbi:MAG: sugar ABC transporter substrate-binding protein [bacterium]